MKICGKLDGMPIEGSEGLFLVAMILFKNRLTDKHGNSSNWDSWFTMCMLLIIILLIEDSQFRWSIFLEKEEFSLLLDIGQSGL